MRRSRSGYLNIDLATSEGVGYLFGSTVQTMAEGVVVTIFVVVTHLVVDDFLPWGVCGCFYADFFAVGRLETRAILSFGDVDSRVQVVVVMVRALENELSLFTGMSVMARKLYVDVGCRVFSALTLTARTAVTIFFTSDTNLFLRIVLFPRRKVSGQRRVVTFPSGALLFLREIDLSFYMGLSSCFNGVAPVRRREDAEGNRDSGVKVQVDDLSSENTSRMPFDLPKGRQEGVSCF